MPALILDGKALAKETEAALKIRVEHCVPALARHRSLLLFWWVMTPHALTYGKMKGSACERIGMQSLRVLHWNMQTSTRELLG
jgi:methylenetetrahydrofolate dehydrogenase (NADP+)/methenyltetrahydrofolate cyclohydrolase